MPKQLKAGGWTDRQTHGRLQHLERLMTAGLRRNRLSVQQLASRFQKQKKRSRMLVEDAVSVPKMLRRRLTINIKKHILLLRYGSLTDFSVIVGSIGYIARQLLLNHMTVFSALKRFVERGCNVKEWLRTYPT